MKEEKKLKKKMVGLQEKAVKSLGGNTDVLISTHNDGQCGVILHGSTSNIAQSIFAMIFDNKNKISADLYHIVKLVALNIVGTESPYAIDLINSILNVTDKTGPSDELPFPEGGAVCVPLKQANDEKGN